MRLVTQVKTVPHILLFLYLLNSCKFNHSNAIRSLPKVEKPTSTQTYTKDSLVVSVEVKNPVQREFQQKKRNKRLWIRVCTALQDNCLIRGQMSQDSTLQWFAMIYSSHFNRKYSKFNCLEVCVIIFRILRKLNIHMQKSNSDVGVYFSWYYYL